MHNGFTGNTTIEVMSLQLAELLTCGGQELTTRNVAHGIEGEPLENRDKCVALVVNPREPGLAAIGLVVDLTYGTVVWNNPANEPGVTGNFLAAILTLAEADNLQNVGERV